MNKNKINMPTNRVVRKKMLIVVYLLLIFTGFWFFLGKIKKANENIIKINEQKQQNFIMEDLKKEQEIFVTLMDDKIITGTTENVQFLSTLNDSVQLQMINISQSVEQNGTLSLNKNLTAEVFDETVLLDSTLLKLKELLKCEQRKVKKMTYLRGNYWVMLNFHEPEERSIECHTTLTYVTHGEFTFMSNLEYLSVRWNAPISFALYAPGYDAETTVNSIRYVRDCSTVKDFVRKWVSFHIYFPVDHMPENIPNVSQVFNCSEIAPYMIKDSSSSYKKNKSLIYPVNVGRNIARDASVTHYYLMLDIELYPTPNLAARFLNMIARNHTLADGNWNKVFVVPPFEIEADQMIPDNKTQLLQMLNAKSAIRFHQNLCPQCHTVAFYDKWIQQGQTKNLEITGFSKRVGPYFNWEPLFISTHSEPYVDERLSWDGMRDKMTMSYVLCLLDYDFLVLSNAFVVHHPGIKRTSQLPNAMRSQLMYKQSKFIDSVIKKELQVVYPTRQGCVL